MKIIYLFPLFVFATIPAFANIGFTPYHQAPSTGGSNPAELYCTLGDFLNSYNSTTNSFTCATGGGGGITSINGDGTPAQIISGSANEITIGEAGATHTIDVGTDIVQIDQANSYSATGQKFLDDGIEFSNPAETFQYILSTGAILADRIISFPVLGADDQFTFNSASQTLTTKTIDADSNTITNIENADIKASAGIVLSKLAITGTPDGTKFLRDDASWQTVSGGVADGDKGDITVTGTGATWTIDPDVVTYAKMQNVVSDDVFLGRISGANGNVEELTGTQATTLLDAFTSALNGLAPASGGGTTNFLRADGTWAAPTAAAPTSGYLMAHWTMSQTKSNIGTSFIDVYVQTNSNGKATFIHTGSSTTVRLQIEWNKVGAGTQSCQVVDIANAANILVTLTVVSGSNDSGFGAIPAGLLNAEKNYKIQCKSTTGTDDPIFESASVWIK